MMNETENKEKVIISLSGRIDSNNAFAVQEDIDRQLSVHKGQEPVIDAEKLTYISSAGLRVLLKVQKQAGKPLALINVSKDIYDMLETTGFTELFRVKKAYRQLSVEGLDVIGRGFFGTVYRMDDDTIVKVYRGGEDSIPMIENDIRMARTAFLHGIPTAIAYDIVKVGEDYGSVFEMLKSSTYMEWIIESPEEKKRIVDSYAYFMKQVNGTEIDEEALPSARQKYLDYLDTVRSLFSQEQFEQLRQLIEAVPESKNAVHGDFHLKNVMRIGEEPILIDMDTMSVGNGVFELAGVFFGYIPFDEDEPGNIMKFHGIPFELAEYIWERTLDIYFEDMEEDRVADMRNRVMLLGWLYFLYRMQTDFRETPLSGIRTRHACQHIEDLLALVDELAI